MEKPPLPFTKRLALKRNIPPPPPLNLRNLPVEIQPENDLRFKNLFHELCFGDNSFCVVSRQGKRNYRYVCFSGSSNKSFFGVYEGLERVNAVEFVAEDFHKNVFEMMKNCEEKEEKEEKEDEAFRAAYLKTESDFLEKGLKSGACCVTVLIQNQEMIVSNMGDCRAVLCREGGVFEALPSDHKAGRDQVIGEHKTRIFKLEEDMEFLVLASAGIWDVVSNQEAVDTVVNVLAQDHRESEDEALIQMLDNLMPCRKLQRVWLVKQQKELLPVESPIRAKPTMYTRSDGESPTSKQKKIKAACKELVNLAVSRGSKDDITVVIVDLKHYN
ncbi:unnamed protein product [Microthlaspi erraticum]|uniref:PPM-type phosphatase domain-containing protein n=1 Tax=Microthlaspi erraticum TaxID=1685480 RepID=A0A6D2K9D3_9BRAS|nr:unnamed protein product [Microthlaspi erraticum]